MTTKQELIQHHKGMLSFLENNEQGSFQEDRWQKIAYHKKQIKILEEEETE